MLVDQGLGLFPLLPLNLIKGTNPQNYSVDSANVLKTQKTAMELQIYSAAPNALKRKAANKLPISLEINANIFMFKNSHFTNISEATIVLL